MVKIIFYGPRKGKKDGFWEQYEDEMGEHDDEFDDEVYIGEVIHCPVCKSVVEETYLYDGEHWCEECDTFFDDEGNISDDDVSVMEMTEYEV